MNLKGNSNMWDSTYLDLGEIKENQIVKGAFSINRNDVSILRIDPGCGCTKAYFNNKKREVVFSYKADPVPIHLRIRGWYETTKEILAYTNLGRTILHFKVKVII